MNLRLGLSFALLAAGCGEARSPVRIASNDFSGQKILAEMMALLAEERGIAVERAIPYGNNRENLAAIEQGIIDAYPEYDGTLLALSGAAVPVGEVESSGSVHDLVEPVGLRWLEPFGLEDGFVVVVRRDVAIRRGLEQISDLVEFRQPLQIAADRGFVSRPIDGLRALARRYGLNLGKTHEFPVGHRDPLFDALAQGTVDASVVFGTDSRLDDYVVAPLEDDLAFFPKYRPAPLVRAAAVQARPALLEAWKTLGGRVDTKDMRRMTTRVDRSGEDYAVVARQYLESIGLLEEEDGPPAGRRRAVRLAVTPMSNLGYFPMTAAAGIREVMPARSLVIRTSSVPALDVREGRTRLGLVGAEDLFETSPDGVPMPMEGLEAVGVVGTRLAHVIARVDSVEAGTWRRVAVGPAESGTWKLGRFVLEASGLDQQADLVSMADPEVLTESLRAKRIDAAIVMVEPGHPGLLRLLQDPEIHVVDFPALPGESLSLRHPYLRPARIPPNTYPRQRTAIETVSAQVVLASRVPPQTGLLGNSGPGVVSGIFTRLPQRLPFDTAKRLSDALASPEMVDPLLPTSPGLRPDTPPASKRLVFHLVPALLNTLALAFLVVVVLVYLQAVPERPDLEPEPNPSSTGEHDAEPT